MDVHSNRGLWADIEPTGISKKEIGSWLFARYWEFPSERKDGQDYIVFLFRNEERTVFGMKEFREAVKRDYGKMARRIIKDKEYRESLVSPDPDLPKIWKRR
jgi:hypothetical protein